MATSTALFNSFKLNIKQVRRSEGSEITDDHGTIEYSETIYCSNPLLQGAGSATRSHIGRVKRLWFSGSGSMEAVETGAIVPITLQENWRENRDMRRIPKSMLESGKMKICEALLVVRGLKKYDELFLQFFGWFEDTNHLFIVTESSDSHCCLNGPIPESQAKVVTKQLLEGLKVLEDMKLVHGELYPRNIFVVSVKPLWVKLGGFGVCIPAKAEQGYHIQTAYDAPEVLFHLELGDYARDTRDIWSLGCVLWLLLTGESLFHWEERVLRRVIYHRDTPVKVLTNRKVSDAAVALVKRLVTVAPEKRPTTRAVLRDPWFFGEIFGDEDSDDCDGDIVEGQPQETAILPHTCSTLHCAVKHGDSTILGSFIKAGAGIEAKGHFGRTPLLEAAQAGNTPAVAFLIQQGADVGAVDQYKSTALHLAAAGGHAGIAELLIQECQDTSQDRTHSTPFDIAVWFGHESMVELFMEWRGDHYFSVSPVEGAIQFGNPSMVRLLLRNGIPLQDRFRISYFSLLRDAARYGNVEAARVIVEMVDKVEEDSTHYHSPIEEATITGHCDMVEFLLGVGFSLRHRDSKNNTLLHLAVGGKHKAMAQFLIKNGADVNAKGAGGQTPLYNAGYQVALILLSHGAEINIQDGNGKTPLQWALRFQRVPVAKLLIERGAHLDERSRAHIEGIEQSDREMRRIDLKSMLWQEDD